MKETRVKEENFICIQGWMISKLKLKGNDLLVYAIIYGFSQDGSSWFSGGLQYLADWVNGTKHGVMKNLKHLESMGLIKKVSEVIDKNTVVKYQYIQGILSDCGKDVDRCGQDDNKLQESDNNLDKNSFVTEEGNYLEPENNKTESDIGMDQSHDEMKQSYTGYETQLHGGMEQSYMGYETQLHGGMKLSSPNNINIKDSLKYNLKDSSSGEEPSRPELIKSIIDQWNALEEYGIRPVKRLSPDSVRYGMLNARINEYGYEDVIQAVENIKQSSFLQGSNSNGWMIDFEWFVKPNNFVKVWEGKYIDDQKGAKNNDKYRGYSGKHDAGDGTEPCRKYSPADIYGEQWKEDFFGD